MDLHPHLHLLVPSTSPGIELEARLYLSRDLLDHLKSLVGSGSGSKSIKGLSTSSASVPIQASELEHEVLVGLRSIDRLVIASHPWGRFGGNMLYPVIALHLVSAALVPDIKTSTPTRQGSVDAGVIPESRTGVLCYNVRGVGRSGGRQPWLGAGEGDYGAVEAWGIGVTGVKDIWRFGYSWGSISATHAPKPSVPIRSLFLLSPPLSPLKLLRWYTPMITSVGDHLKSSAVWMVYGTKDEFTRAAVYTGLKGMVEKGWGRAIEVEEGSHFWGGEEGDRIREVLRDWLRR